MSRIVGTGGACLGFRLVVLFFFSVFVFGDFWKALVGAGPQRCVKRFVKALEAAWFSCFVKTLVAVGRSLGGGFPALEDYCSLVFGWFMLVLDGG